MTHKARSFAADVPATYHRIAVVFDLPESQTLDYQMASSRMNTDTVTRMWCDYQASKPTEDELRGLGFDSIIWVRGPQDTDNALLAIKEQACHA